MSPIQLDPRTVALVTNLVTLTITLLAFLLWLSKEMHPGFGRWAIGRVVGAFTVVFSFQIGGWPLAQTATAACALLSATIGMDACAQFLGFEAHSLPGRNPPRYLPRLYVPWVYLAITLVLLQVIAIQPFAWARQCIYVEVTFLLGVLHCCTGAILLRGIADPSKSRGRIVAGAINLLRSIIYGMRSYYFIANPQGTLLDSNTVNYAFLLGNIIFEIVVNFAFFLMNYERVLEDRAQEVVQTVAANKSLTELKDHLEERVHQRTAELVRSQKLESVARLAGGVAHDFNNVLMVINGYSALLLAQLKSDDPMYDPIKQIGKAGDRAAGITRQLLTFSRQQSYDPQNVSANELLTGMMDMLRRLIGEDIEIILKPVNGGDGVRADKGQLEQVIMNLAINARDAMPGGGKLFLDTSVETVEADFAAECLDVPAGKYVVVTVTDTGIGMTPEVQARIFEPFYTTKGQEGTGLGLSTTYGIVKQSGGCITVQSTPGFGTTFKVYLPAVQAEAVESLSLASFDSPAKGSETILVVEDQEEVRRFMRDILGGHGYHTLEASGGDEAISIVGRYPAPIHLLISDMVLPQMNGPEIVNRIRHVHPSIGILMMSGYTAERLDGQLPEDTPYLQKPFTPESLLRSVREILDLARSLEPIRR